MKTQSTCREKTEVLPKGFALIVSLWMMVLVTLIAVGLLSLSAITLKQNSATSAQAQAQANARLALMIAIGELQKEMGPDARVSAESAIFDTSADTPSVEGVAQSRWLASYHSWGNWLNADYQIPGGPNLRIGDTYEPRRARMFRRWLLSLPNDQENNINAPDSVAGWDDTNSIVLVGHGSLGTSAPADQITRAYLISVDGSGYNAWWIGPENHKARIDLGKEDSRYNFSPSEWQLAQSDTAEVGVGGLPGLGALDQNTTLGPRLITRHTLRLADVEENRAKGHFFDLTAHSRGVLASTRTGALKKDLSLLFELPESQLPQQYRLIAGAIQEPSIRPISPDLSAKNPTIPFRHMQSWTNMRHYHRMYRRPSDATTGGSAGTGGSGSLNWDVHTPWTDMMYRSNHNAYNTWPGQNNYMRFPILAKVTYIYSLQTEWASGSNYRLFLVYTPVFTFWNPYNVEMRIPSDTLQLLSGAFQCLPLGHRFYIDNTVSGTSNGGFGSYNPAGKLRMSDGSVIIFKPGELKTFSPARYGGSFDEPLVAGFNPLGINAGDRLRIGGNTLYTQSQNPGLSITFGHPGASFNINDGGTPGSFMAIKDWTSNSFRMPMMYQHDWFQKAQQFTPITLDARPIPNAVGGIATAPQNIDRWIFDGVPHPIAYAQLVFKGISASNHEGISWKEDWRGRNWLHSPPHYFGGAMYISENDSIARTQRLDNPYIMNFGPLVNLGEAVALVDPFRDRSKAALGSGPNPVEIINRLPMLELPTAPPGSLASYAGMRTNPGWHDARQMTWLRMGGLSGQNSSTREASTYRAEVKAIAYQSGVTGPGIGNSFIHPVLPRTEIYQYLDNSKSQDPVWRNQMDASNPSHEFQENDNRVFNDYWDHTLLLNDALWDDYFVSSLSDQVRPGADTASSLQQNLDRLVRGEPISNSRYHYHPMGLSNTQVSAELAAADGYLKAARHLIVDGMFNVNSTSTPAWHALFAGIRERSLVYRENNGSLRKVEVPPGKRIAISRFDTEVSDREVEDPESGVTMPDQWPGWSGVRFLDDAQLQKLAEECVKQVKLRGPFLNFSEFINRRLSNDRLGLMGALQSAIDYDDAIPDPRSINYLYKSDSDYMMRSAALGSNSFQTPEAVDGSRFAGIPGYVIQSDLLKPIANTLSVRDDTFCVRAYGDARDAQGKVIARAWCEAIVQRVPDYADGTNDASVPARIMTADGRFTDNDELTPDNRRFGRQFKIHSFRWLHPSEI
ncbi:MAG: hypothetical protein ACNA8L_01335 [Luteolibacter sp.]